MSEFKYSDSNKRYYTLDYYYKHKYGCKIAKISLNMGLTCPNKDGKVGYGGCIYCSKLGSGEYAGDKNKPLKEQFDEVKNVMIKKWPSAKFIAYFQANTNTYAPIEKLKKAWEEVLTYDNVVGINISTRPDAIEKECYDYLEELNKKTDLVVELGLQTIHDKTSKFINRCHDLNSFETALNELNKRGIKVLVHVMFSLPYETKDMMLDTIKYLSNKNIWGIKIHMLHILKGTLLAITENGFGKRTELDEYRVQNRGGRGVITYKITPKTGDIVGVRIANDEDDAMLITEKGTIIRIHVKDISILGRATQGVTLMRTSDGGKVVSIETLTPEINDSEE